MRPKLSVTILLRVFRRKDRVSSSVSMLSPPKELRCLAYMESV